MREICTYGSTRGLQLKVACDPVHSSRVRRNVLGLGGFFHLRSTLLVKRVLIAEVKKTRVPFPF